jgi:RNA polymerase sigma factor (sigma-70 family)
LPTSLRLTPEHKPKIVELYRGAEIPVEWGVSIGIFTDAIERSVRARFRDSQPAPRDISAYLQTLRCKDLALARACASGNNIAWDYFVEEYRPELYRAARAIAGDSIGRELADSLLGDLFGLEIREGRRRSLFDYFHGRSKLGTWLRAILAQRHVDEIRRTRRTDSLDEIEADGPDAITLASQPTANDSNDPERLRYLALLQSVLTAALAALEPRDRLRLAYYYVDELTLAQIGRLMGEHEATASRKLERLRRDLRLRVDAELRDKKRLSEAQVRLCYEYAQEEWPFDLTRVLTTKE